MDSLISLAIATKLRKLFETSPDVFLTFPSGTGFTYRYLNFMKDPSISGLTLQEHSNNRADFARLLNLIPDDSPGFSPDAGRFLWDSLKEVLNASTFADSALTPAEDDQLNQAIDFLTDLKEEDGMQVPIYSAALNKYYQYKTAYDQAEAAYLDEKITVECSTGVQGEQLKQRWAASREKQLLDLKAQADQDWQNLGFKEQVKNAQQIRVNLEPKKFLDSYRAAYLSEIASSEIPDLNALGIPACTTFFSPFDAFEQTLPWSKINLTKSEIETLVASAPADLKPIFNEGEDGRDIKSVALEYNNVVLVRAWYKPDLFASRYWKLPDNAMVSDGNVPRRGKIPGFVTSMITVRNVVVMRKKAVQQNPIVLPILTKMPIQKYKVAERPTRLMPLEKPGFEAAPVRNVDRTAASIKRSNLSMAATSSMGAGPASRTLRPAGKSSLMLAPGAAASAHAPAMNLKEQEALQFRQNKRYVDAKYAGTTIKSPVIKIPEKTDAPATTDVSVELVTETFGFDGVAVMAYICKRIPRCPDPDPMLKWD